MAIRSLIINPGSTSTKIGVFDDETQILDKTLRHSTEEISQFADIYAQKDFRKQLILDALKEENIPLTSINVCVGRGGLLRPIPGGTYAVTDALLHDLYHAPQGNHASNLGGILAREIGDSIGVPSYIVDPVVVDELQPVARLSGVPEVPRVSIDHPLNQKAMARRWAKENGKKYADITVIVVHMGLQRRRRLLPGESKRRSGPRPCEAVLLRKVHPEGDGEEDHRRRRIQRLPRHQRHARGGKDD